MNESGQLPNQTNTDVTNIDAIQNEKPKKYMSKPCNKKLWIIISISLAVLVIAAIIVVIVLLLKKPDDHKKIDTTQVTQINTTSEPIDSSSDKESTSSSTDKESISASTDKESISASTDKESISASTDKESISASTDKESISPSTIQENSSVSAGEDTTTETEIVIPSTQNDTNPNVSKPLESEFSFNMAADGLTCISVSQKSNDESKFGDQTISTKTNRQTMYNIFTLSETDAPEEDKLFYKKMYTGVISIVSECITVDEDSCEPQEMVDLTKIKSDPTKSRILTDDNIDLKNAPLAICLFNITDNDFITSMTCHEKFPEIKRHEILLDLYFYRAPAIERKDKTSDNITITIKNDTINNKRYIRELNGGSCKIENSWGSLCTTDMNITTDLNGNLFSYDELAVTDIKYNQKNSFMKRKLSKLVDHSENITQKDAQNYKNNLVTLLEKMKPHMKEEIEFSREEFVELYNLVRYNNTEGKDAETNDENKEESSSRRRLQLTTSNAIQYIKEKELFQIDSLGVQANLNLLINTGINTDKMTTQTKFTFDKDQKEEIFFEQNHLSNIQTIIDELSSLSKAGNYLATELYDTILEKLEMLPNEMSIKLRSLNDLLKFYDLLPVFEHILSTISYSKLPLIIVDLTNDLVIKLNEFYANIKNKGDVKENVEKFGDNLYKYVNNTNDLVDLIYYNLKELGNTLLTKNNSFTEITNYYLNNTADSYYNIIRRARRIFESYFVKEFNLSYPQIEQFIKIFEETSNEALQNDKTYIYDLYNKLLIHNYTITSATADQLQTVLSNLLQTHNITSDIITKIKKFLIEIINIKDSGYYLTNGEIARRNGTYSLILSEAEEVLKKLNNDGLIDKEFDRIMIKFKETYINIIKYMAQIKSEYFTLEEDTLNETLFNDEIKDDIELKIKQFTDNILSKIKREVDYKKKAKIFIEEFNKDNLTELNDLISDLEVLLSEEALENLVYKFEVSLNESLRKFSEDLDKNVILTKQYFEHFYNIIYNNTYLLDILQNYHVEEIPKINAYNKNFTKFEDEIQRKERTTTYLSKYNRIVSVWNYTEKYLKNQFYSEIKEDYKQIFTNIKEMLQSVINLESLKNYTDQEDLEFASEHKKIIEKLQNRVDTYFSIDIFEKKYSSYVDGVINKYKTVVQNIIQFINVKNKEVIKLRKIDDSVNDFCIVYKRKICYGCPNCVWNTFDYGRFCIVLTPYDNNYLSIINYVFDNVENNINFEQPLNSLVSEISIRINKYNSLIKNLENNLIIIKNETLNSGFNYSIDYLNSYSEWVKEKLEEQFDKNIVNSSYNYYYTNTKNKIVDILEDIAIKWKNAYKVFAQDVIVNFGNIKYSIYEFSMMGEIYQTILKTDLISNYFKSIIYFQRTEFNYTITHYYDYLYKLIDNSYTYIIANFPKEENEFNQILMERKNETIKYFSIIFESIKESNFTATNITNQENILKVKEDDFFKTNSKIKSKINEIDEYLDDRIDDIFDYELFHSTLAINQYALTARYYLENKEFGKLIEEIYEPIDSKTFFYLNLSNFKGLMTNNWIVDSSDFINILNDALYDTNKEIKNELNIKLESYSNDIKNELKNYFKEDIENIITDLYTNNIKDLTTTQINNIYNLIQNNLDTIKQKIKAEMINVINDGKNYYIYQKIENTMEYYKEYVIKKLNYTLSDVLDEFYKNIKTNVYSNCIENSLTQYLKMVKEQTDKTEFAEYKMLNSSYKIGEIIYSMTENIVKKIKIITQKKIYFKYIEYYNKIKSSLNYTKIQNIINKEIDNIYNEEIISVLENNNKLSTDSVSDEFDLKISLKQEINSTIETTMNNIKNIIIKIKGNNFNADYTCPLVFSSSSTNIIKTICESFKEILIIENEEQGIKIKEYIKNIITSNLDDFLKKVIPTFGNEYFDRIIDYNINFKIIDLYNNLRYALGQIFLYYAALARYRDDVEDLPIDLRDRLYRLNDLDYVIESKKDDIIELLEEKLNELISDLKNIAKDKYTSYFEDNQIIKNNFESSIIEIIENNLVEIMPLIEKEYNTALEKYLKEKFMDAFTDILNEKTNNMITIFNEEKERLITELDSLFSLTTDKDLNEVNRNINNTVCSIRKYYKYIKTFTIPEDFEIFFNNYANITITPLFEQFRNDLEIYTFMMIEETINNNSKSIEKINIKEIFNMAYDLMDYFRDNFYTPIIRALENYYISYSTKLEEKKNNYLTGSGFGIEGLVEYKDEMEAEEKRKESKDVEETFSELYQLAVNAQNSFYSSFDYFAIKSKIEQYISNNNFNYKYLKKWIKNNQYHFRIHNFLMTKLYFLYQIIDNYYAYSKVGVLEFRTHMTTYANLIYSRVVLCRTTTANTLNNKYEKILSNSNNFNTTYTNTSDEIIYCDYKHKTEHMINRAYATITGIKEYSRFELNTSLTGTLFKTPEIKAQIVDKTRPDKLNLNVRAEYGFCGRTSYMYDALFNDANYTMTIDYNTKTNNININTYTNFDSYNYTWKMYQIPDKYYMDNITYMGYTVNFFKQCYNQDNRTLTDVFTTEVDAKHYIESMTIVG